MNQLNNRSQFLRAGILVLISSACLWICQCGPAQNNWVEGTFPTYFDFLVDLPGSGIEIEVPDIVLVYDEQPEDQYHRVTFWFNRAMLKSSFNPADDLAIYSSDDGGENWTPESGNTAINKPGGQFVDGTTLCEDLTCQDYSYFWDSTLEETIAGNTVHENCYPQNLGDRLTVVLNPTFIQADHQYKFQLLYADPGRGVLAVELSDGTTLAPAAVSDVIFYVLAGDTPTPAGLPYINTLAPADQTGVPDGSCDLDSLPMPPHGEIVGEWSEDLYMVLPLSIIEPPPLSENNPQEAAPVDFQALNGQGQTFELEGDTVVRGLAPTGMPLNVAFTVSFLTGDEEWWDRINEHECAVIDTMTVDPDDLKDPLLCRPPAEAPWAYEFPLTKDWEGNYLRLGAGMTVLEVAPGVYAEIYQGLTLDQDPVSVTTFFRTGPVRIDEELGQAVEQGGTIKWGLTLNACETFNFTADYLPVLDRDATAPLDDPRCPETITGLTVTAFDSGFDQATTATAACTLPSSTCLDTEYGRAVCQAACSFLPGWTTVSPDPLYLRVSALSSGPIVEGFDQVPVFFNLSQDSDSDNLTDLDEVTLHSTNPCDPDTDGDGLDDDDEVNTYLTDPLNPDTDGDGLDDGEEITDGTNPRDPVDRRAMVLNRILNTTGAAITEAWAGDTIVLEGQYFHPTATSNVVVFKKDLVEVTVQVLGTAAVCQSGYDCVKVKATGVDGGDWLTSIRYLPGASESNQLPLNFTGIFFFHTDHRGAITAMTDREGNVAWAAEYLPFGDVVDSTVVGPLTQRRQLQSSYVDIETSLDPAGDLDDSTLLDMGARYYDSELGRFYSYDPMTASLHPYDYANNNPYTFVDHHGQFIFLPLLYAGGAIILGTGIGVGVPAAIIHAFGATGVMSEQDVAEADQALKKSAIIGVSPGLVAGGIGLYGVLPEICAMNPERCMQVATASYHVSTFLLESVGGGAPRTQLPTIQGKILTPTQGSINVSKVELYSKQMIAGEFDWLNMADPIIIDQAGNIMGGHHRILAAWKAGIEIPEWAIKWVPGITERVPRPWEEVFYYYSAPGGG